jgi:hypothetical protein
MTPFTVLEDIQVPDKNTATTTVQIQTQKRLKIGLEVTDLVKGIQGTITNYSPHFVEVNYPGIGTKTYPRKNWRAYFKTILNNNGLTPLKENIVKVFTQPEELNVGMRVKVLDTYDGLESGGIGEIINIHNQNCEIHFLEPFASNNPLLHAGDGYTTGCWNYYIKDWKQMFKVVPSDYIGKGKTPPEQEKLDQKFIDIGMEILFKGGCTYYILPMTYQPKFLRKEGHTLYEIPNFIQERLKEEVKCVCRKNGSHVSLATLDMKKGFVHFHGGADYSPFESFCTGTLDVYIKTPEDAINARDRCQTMLEIIGYDTDAPRTTVKNVNLSEIKEWSLIPAKTRAFQTDDKVEGKFYLSNDSERKKAIDKVRKKFEYLKNIINTVDAVEMQEETKEGYFEMEKI